MFGRINYYNFNIVLVDLYIQILFVTLFTSDLNRMEKKQTEGLAIQYYYSCTES
jgi:hypothetical protein